MTCNLTHLKRSPAAASKPTDMKLKQKLPFILAQAINENYASFYEPKRTMNN